MLIIIIYIIVKIACHSQVNSNWSISDVLQTCKDTSRGFWSYPYDCTQYVDCSDLVDPNVKSCDDGLVYLHPYACMEPNYAPCSGIKVPENETGNVR